MLYASLAHSVYKEFIPIAIDLVQAQRASAYAQTMTTNVTEAAYKSALHRIQHSKDLHRCMDSGLGSLDPKDTGTVATGDLVELLRSMDLDLTDGEIGAVLSKLKALARGSAEVSKAPSKAVSGAATPSRASQPITYKLLQDNYEDLLLDCLQQHQLDKDASDVEIYLNAKFKAKDLSGTGLLNEKTIEDILRSEDFTSRISLSSTQIYAMLGDHKPVDGWYKYRGFARKAAFMIHQLFDSSTLSERTAMISRSSITPIQLLSKASRRRIESQMAGKFREFDADNDGRLDGVEFTNCMADTGLVLSVTEIEVLRQRAENPATHVIDLPAWMKFAYETLLHLQRDAALKKHMTAVLQQESEKKEPTAVGAEAAGESPRRDEEPAGEAEE